MSLLPCLPLHWWQVEYLQHDCDVMLDRIVAGTHNQEQQQQQPEEEDAVAAAGGATRKPPQQQQQQRKSTSQASLAAAGAISYGSQGFEDIDLTEPYDLGSEPFALSGSQGLERYSSGFPQGISRMGSQSGGGGSAAAAAAVGGLGRGGSLGSWGFGDGAQNEVFDDWGEDSGVGAFDLTELEVLALRTTSVTATGADSARRAGTEGSAGQAGGAAAATGAVPLQQEDEDDRIRGDLLLHSDSSDEQEQQQQQQQQLSESVGAAAGASPTPSESAGAANEWVSHPDDGLTMSQRDDINSPGVDTLGNAVAAADGAETPPPGPPTAAVTVAAAVTRQAKKRPLDQSAAAAAAADASASDSEGELLPFHVPGSIGWQQQQPKQQRRLLLAEMFELGSVHVDDDSSKNKVSGLGRAGCTGGEGDSEQAGGGGGCLCVRQVCGAGIILPARAHNISLGAPVFGMGSLAQPLLFLLLLPLLLLLALLLLLLQLFDLQITTELPGAEIRALLADRTPLLRKTPSASHNRTGSHIPPLTLASLAAAAADAPRPGRPSAAAATPAAAAGAVGSSSSLLAAQQQATNLLPLCTPLPAAAVAAVGGRRADMSGGRFTCSMELFDRASTAAVQQLLLPAAGSSSSSSNALQGYYLHVLAGSGVAAAALAAEAVGDKLGPLDSSGHSFNHDDAAAAAVGDSTGAAAGSSGRPLAAASQAVLASLAAGPGASLAAAAAGGSIAVSPQLPALLLQGLERRLAAVVGGAASAAAAAAGGGVQDTPLAKGRMLSKAERLNQQQQQQQQEEEAAAELLDHVADHSKSAAAATKDESFAPVDESPMQEDDYMQRVDYAMQPNLQVADDLQNAAAAAAAAAAAYDDEEEWGQEGFLDVGGEEAGGDEQVARPVVKDDAAAGFTRVTQRVSEKGGEGVSSQGGRQLDSLMVMEGGHGQGGGGVEWGHGQGGRGGVGFWQAA
jgi:hypothetical protein